MGRLIGFLLGLNVMMLVAGLSLEHVHGQSSMPLDFNADKVRLIGRAERPAGAAAEPVASDPAASVLPEAAALDMPAPVARCLSWPEIDADLFAAIEARMRDVGIDVSRYDIQLQKRLPWWVYLPPFPNAELARSAIESVRLKGVKDVAAVRGGVMKYAVSLGVFSSLAKARAQSAVLRAQGIQNVRVGPRPNAGIARLQIADTVAESQLSGLAAGWREGMAPMPCVGN